MFPYAAVWVILTLAVAAAGQNIINTVAGGGEINSNPALADIPGPTAVVEDAAGNKYVAAPYSDYVFELTTSNTVQVLAGLGWGHYNKNGGGTCGPADEIPLYAPTGLATDKKGDVYIADSVNNVIREVYLNNGTYDICTVAGQRPSCNQQKDPTCGDGGPARKGYLANPEGVAVGGKGDFYIADTGDNVIRIVSAGIINRFAGSYGPPCPDPTSQCGDGGPATQAQLNGPTGVSLGLDNNGKVNSVYIADTYDHRIRCVAAVAGGCFSGSTAGYIYRAAGTGKAGYSGDNGPATQAELRVPQAVSAASPTTYYIADTGNSCIRKVSSGTISDFAGKCTRVGFSGDGGSATQAAMMTPSGVYVDAAGNVLIADTGNQRIRQVTGGLINTILGGGNGGDGSLATAAMLANPYQVAADPAGTYYVIADAANNRIRAANPSQNNQVTVATVTIPPLGIATIAGNGNAGHSGDSGLATLATLNSPLGIALDALGNIFFSDSYSGWVREINGATGIIMGVLPTKGVVKLPEALAIDSSGNLFIADPPAEVIWEVSGDTIKKVAGNGTAGHSGDYGPATQAELDQPTGIAIDANGNLYIADSLNNVVRCVLGVLEGCGGTPKNYPVGTIVPYAYNGNEGFSGDGGPATQASRWGATEVAVDLGGNLFISGGTHDRVVQRVDAAPPYTIITVAGDEKFQPGFGFSGDGGAAATALINSAGLALDSNEDLLIADNGNNRIREVNQLIAVVSLKPKSLDFGDVQVGQKSQPQTVTLENIGANDLSISQIKIGGADWGDFSETNNCPSAPIPPLTNNYSTCTINVTFAPTAKGNREAVLTITDNGFGSPQQVKLSGKGT